MLRAVRAALGHAVAAGGDRTEHARLAACARAGEHKHLPCSARSVSCKVGGGSSYTNGSSESPGAARRGRGRTLQDHVAFCCNEEAEDDEDKPGQPWMKSQPAVGGGKRRDSPLRALTMAAAGGGAAPKWANLRRGTGWGGSGRGAAARLRGPTARDLRSRPPPCSPVQGKGSGGQMAAALATKAAPTIGLSR